MWLDGLLLLVGLAIMVKGADLFVGASVRIAELLGLPRVVIGSTLVSLATTSPELVVSVTASLRGEPGLAVGNAVGSCIANIALIVGTVGLLRTIDVDPRHVRASFWIMLALGLLVFAMTLDLTLGWLQGGLLLLLATAYMVFNFFQHRRALDPAEDVKAAALEAEVTASLRFVESPLGVSLVFLFGAAMVLVGSRVLVDSAIVIARGLGVPAIVIGLTVVAVGTSLPEYVTAVASARRGVSDLSVGNILGANVLNLGLIVGISAVIHEVTMSRVTQLYNFPVMLLVMILLGVYLLRVKRLGPGAGALLLGLYGAYVLGLVLLAVAGLISVAE
jgi:cation:H+ antiporter